MERESFVFYKSFYEVSQNLSDQDRLILYDKIIQYWIEWKNVPKEWISETLFILIKPQIDKNNSRYDNWKKQWHHWKTGWRPKKNPTGVTKENPMGFIEKTPNVNDNDNVNDNECISIHTDNMEWIKKYIKEVYGEEDVQMNLKKYRLLVVFVENGYSKIPKTKKWMDDFFDVMKKKSELYWYSANGMKANWDDLLIVADKMFTRSKEKNHTIENYLSQFNKFLERKVEKK